MGKQLDRDVLIDHLRRMMEARQIDRLPKSGYAKAIEDVAGCPTVEVVADREKVMKGLKKLYENSGCIAVYDIDCKTCPYEKVNGCCGKIIEDALALLKADATRMDGGGRRCGRLMRMR